MSDKMQKNVATPTAKSGSLYRQLTTTVILSISLVALIFGTLDYLYAQRSQVKLFENKVSQYETDLQRLLEPALWTIDDGMVSQIGNALSTSGDIATLSIRDEQQRLVYHYEGRGGQRVMRNIVIRHDGVIIGNAELGLALQAYQEESRRTLLATIGFAFLLAVLLLISLRWSLNKVLKHSLDSLISATRKVVDGQYQYLSPSDTHIEFAPIVSGINAMSEAVATREQALRASEEKLLTILDGVDAYIYLKGMDGRYLFANRPMRALWHAEMEDIIGFGDEKFFAAETAKDIRANDRRVLDGGETLRAEERRTSERTGQTIIYQSTKLPLRRDDGSIYALCGISMDITARIHAAEALQASEQRLSLATQAGKIGIWDWDISNNMLLWDDSMYLLYGIRKEDFGGAYDAWSRTLHPDDLQYAEQEIQAALRGEREYSLEFRIIRPDGAVRMIKADSRTYRDELGNATRMIGTNIDVTERKMAELELRRYKDNLEEEVQARTTELVLARDAAEAANKAKSVFLANMSHELRTPLNAILGFSNLLRRDAQLSETQRRNLDIINRSGEHLLTLINDVLEMAKIEAGRIKLEEAEFDLGDMVRDITDMMSVRAGEKGLRLLIDQSSSFPRYIVGDEARLRQILINLVGNAVKFTSEGGVTLRLGTRQNAVSHLRIEVEDTGPGIPPEDQQRIFEPFVQLGEHGVNKGTGLGLTITRQFVHLMGGKLTLESTPGKGSIFCVELVLKSVTPSEITKPKEVRPGDVIGLLPGQPEYRILIVEDQEENQLLLARLMEIIGLPFKIAANGAEGVELFKSWHPHLIWMDRRMPVMDGLDATRAIRQLPEGKSVKIVAVTASAFVDQREEMLQIGMDDFVRKPYRMSEIYECLAKQLGLQYAYEGAVPTSGGSEQLTPDAFSKLPGTLRILLKEAIESLEGERIQEVMAQIGVVDADLHERLHELVDNYDYQTILDALEPSNSGKNPA